MGRYLSAMKFNKTMCSIAQKKLLNRRFFLCSSIAACGLFAIGNNHAIAQAIDLPNEVERKTISIAAGETINQALLRLGALPNDVNLSVRALARTIDIGDIKRNDQLTVFLRQEGNKKVLLGFNLASGANKSITVSRTVEGNYKSRELTTKLQKRTLRVAGVIGAKGLLESVREQGAPDRVADNLAEAFAYDVDFEREIGAGASFELMFDRVSDTRGIVVREGEPVFAAITLLSGRSIQLYRFLAPGAIAPEWYDAQGRSARKFLMKTPINGARLTSGFGMRFHPVLGYNKMHAGVDFGAPIGTPIYAAGDGIVTRASVMGGYGNVIDIEHGSGWSTRYAHLSRFLSGLRPGDKVRQGQVIAYSGNTGRSTGPHLHFEVRLNGEPINPNSAKIPQGRALSGDALTKYKAIVTQIDILRRDAIKGVNLGSDLIKNEILLASN